MDNRRLLELLQLVDGTECRGPYSLPQSITNQLRIGEHDALDPYLGITEFFGVTFSTGLNEAGKIKLAELISIGEIAGAEATADPLDEIMSIYFDAEYSVISGFNVMLLAMEHDQRIVRLVEFVKGKFWTPMEVSGRAQNLLKDVGDVSFVHPNDIRVAALLYILRNAECSSTVYQLAKIAQGYPTLFWAAQMAKYVLENTEA